MSEAVQNPSSDDVARAEKLMRSYKTMEQEIHKFIVGQNDIIELLLVSLFSNGHCLMMGVPGLAKTAMVSTLSQVMHLSFRRIQFTPDLMPSDITGTEIIQEDADGRRKMEFMRGPIFANIVLADEINRTPPKTQAALLEAMQEKRVTVGNVTYKLPDPFFVLATQNPIEQEGTYPLPEAQLDRFMFMLQVRYPSRAEERQILERTTTSFSSDIKPVLEAQDLKALQETVRRVPIGDHVYDYVLDLVRSTRVDEPDALPIVKKYVSWGAGPRACQYLILGAKARALLKGRFYVNCDDVASVAPAALSHRVVLNFTAEAEGLTSRKLVETLLEQIPKPVMAAAK
jgi:MoxR-like ATPase